MAAQLWEPEPARYRPHEPPEGAPPDLDIRTEAPRPLLASQATLDTELGSGAAPIDGSDRPHRLVVVGDSISQGFQSFAIHRTDASWPALVAGAFGFPFRFPTFAGPTDNPGLPFNLESIVNAIQGELGDAPLNLHMGNASAAVLQALVEIRDYWVKGDGNQDPPDQHGFNDNLAIWGFDLRDSLSKSRQKCRDTIDAAGPWFGFIDPFRHLAVNHTNERTTLRTLWNTDEPSMSVTQVSAAQSMGAENDGAGIDNLVVALGANNALQIVRDLEIQWSADAFQDVDKKAAYNLWTPEHFRVELDELVDEILKVNAARTLWLTVPHVTVVPLLRGVGEKPYYSRYYARYTHAWISDAEFDANENAALTGDEARMVDATIDQYNWAIKRHVHEQREKGHDWYLVDLCGLLDRLAYQRYLASPQSRPTWWDQVPTEGDLLPTAMLGMSPRPDTRFFLSDKKGRTQGGLIALDGVHPTTIGYGLIADFVLHVLSDVAGVRHADDGRTAEIEWGQLVADDTLNSRPPAQLTEIGRLIGPIHDHINVFETLFGRRPS